MNKLANIDLDSIKAFIKANTLLCAMAVLDVFLLFAAIGRGNANETLQEKISSLQIKENQIKTNLEKLSGLEKHFDELKNIKTSIFKKCLNFGKRTTVYQFLKALDGFLPDDKLNISNSNLYNINKGRSIDLNRDLSEFDGDNVLSCYDMYFAGKTEDLITLLNRLNELPYFINIQKLEMRHNATASNANTLSVNLSFALLGKIQLGE